MTKGTSIPQGSSECKLLHKPQDSPSLMWTSFIFMSPTFKVKFHRTIFDIIIIICELSIFLPATLDAFKEESLMGKRWSQQKTSAHSNKGQVQFPNNVVMICKHQINQRVIFFSCCSIVTLSFMQYNCIKMHPTTCLMLGCLIFRTVLAPSVLPAARC